jgi:hypothetical protein
MMGMGNGMFGAPNAAAIMNSVPASERGVTSGMMSTLMNSGFVLSMGMFFTIAVVGLTHAFPSALAASLTSAGAPELIPAMSAIPPTGALFAAFLGYNPVNTILAGLSPAVIVTIAPATIATLTGVVWFPTTLAGAFMPSLALSFYIGAVLSVIAAILSAMRGSKFVHDEKDTPDNNVLGASNPNQESGKILDK